MKVDACVKVGAVLLGLQSFGFSTLDYTVANRHSDANGTANSAEANGSPLYDFGGSILQFCRLLLVFCSI